MRVQRWAVRACGVGPRVASGPSLAHNAAVALAWCRYFSAAQAPSKAYDADPSTLFSTNTELNPYVVFQLDGAYSSIYGVTLWARADGWATLQFKNYSVFMSASATPGSGTACARGLTVVSNSNLRIDVPCPAVSGVQYVTVSKTGSGVVSLAEVQVLMGELLAAQAPGLACVPACLDCDVGLSAT